MNKGANIKKLNSDSLKGFTIRNTPMKPRIGIVLKVYQHKSNPSITYTHEIAKVHWLKSSVIEAIPVYLLTHYEIQDKEYECEKI